VRVLQVLVDPVLAASGSLLKSNSRALISIDLYWLLMVVAIDADVVKV